jgi:hypothetical protein
MFRENGIGCRAKMARMNMLRQNEEGERFLAPQTPLGMTA